MRIIAAALLAMLASAAVQQPTIELQKVRTLVDRDGKGFTRAPMHVLPIAGGRYAVSEMNVQPLVVDSTGRLIKRWVAGEGPGEIAMMPVFAPGLADSFYVASGGRVSVFDRDLKFGRSVNVTGIYLRSLVPIENGFVVSGYRRVSPASFVSLHVISSDGKIVRSFLKDTIVNPRADRPEYEIAPGSGNTVWVWSIWTHRIERWTPSGERRVVIDAAPPWTVSTDRLRRPRIQSVREVDGLLWVLSSVPVPDIAERLKASTAGRSEVDARAMPFEEWATARLEAYDAATGKLVADLPIKAFPIGIISDRMLMVHRPGPDDEAQLEIWEMKLKR